MKPWEIINDSLKIIDVVRHYGYEPARYGSFIVCPFHLEKTPSMKIYDNSYHCFGCKASGKVVDFVMNLYNLKCIDACKKIAEDFHLQIDFGGNKKMSIYDLEMMRMEELSRKIKKEEEERLKRQKQGHFEPSEIGKEWEDILYETIVIPPTTDKELQSFINELKEHGEEEILNAIKDISSDKPKQVIRRFRSELIGTPEFDKKLEEYNKLVEQRYKELNKGEESYEQNIGHCD